MKFQIEMNLLKRCGDGWRNHPRWWITTNDGYNLISRKFQSWMETNHNVICKYPCWSLQESINPYQNYYSNKCLIANALNY